MPDRFDVVVVGARCAGSPLAALLAREGVSVALVEQATFPRDTMSSHVLEADGLAFLDRLGLTERVRATGAPFIQQTDTLAGDLRIVAPWPQEEGDVGGAVSVRRFILDPILAETAEEAGAEVRMATKVTGLIEEGGRVGGVRVSRDGEEASLHARLVVGADGRNSTVARLCGARKYNVTPNKRVGYWAFFEGAEIGEPTLVLHRWADRFVLGAPSDSGLYEVMIFPELAELDRLRGDLEASFMDHALSCEPVAKAVAGARPVGKIFGMVRWMGFFREAAGPGWVLVGDAGHFKDPCAGRGMGDAFHQADALAPAIVAGLDGSQGGLDEALARWARWRDEDFAEHYWLATDLGQPGPFPAVTTEVLRALNARGEIGRFIEIQNHRAKPSKVVTPPVLLAATGRMLARRGAHRREILREVGSLVAENVRRQRLNRRPVYADPSVSAADAGPTEVDDRVAA